jgi:DNA-binding beta-propeller fold protein YncE
VKFYIKNGLDDFFEINQSPDVRITTYGFLAAVGGALAFASGCAGDDTNPASAAAPVDASASTDGTTSQVEAGPLPPLEKAPPSAIAPGKRADATSAPIVFDRQRGGVWTANGDVGSISYVDVDAQKVLREIKIGTDIRSVALSPDGVWIAAVDRAGASVTLVDATTGGVRRTIALGTHPRAAVWDASDPRWLYVAIEDQNAVTVVDRTLGVVASTIPVGRLPSGVAVSRQRRELYVTHRIDGKVTIVPLDADFDGGAAFLDASVLVPDATVPVGDAAPVAVPPAPLAGPVDIPLAFEVGDGTATTPHGTPFAFESLAWSPDGNVAWLPHELLGNTHPFQFQTTLFPTVSVVDLYARTEVATDPNDPNGYIAGRKNLFAAINVIDETGNVTVLSQPCAAAFHPNGFAAYVLACGSEDFITFDTAQGIATDILRHVPGDHTTGLALDDTGQRAFVLADQSHSLATIDLAGGSLVAHAKLIAGPLPVVASDPIDADTRAGLTLFYRANSAKGTLASTGNNWMSCGGCHLDGFVSTNNFFFEALSAADQTVDARIGHTGLVDFFSTAPPANEASYPPLNPHDVLLALTEQGGLAPDRTGAQRDGAVDPSMPTADAVTMATQIAKVIARDLPLGPTWLLPGTDKPDTDYDTKWCGECHQAEYAAWQKSAHAHAETDPMVQFCAGVEAKNNGAQYPRLCVGCHSPTSARLGDTTLQSQRGITCLSCHDTERLIRAGGNADSESAAHDWTQSHKDRAKAALTTLRDPKFCGTCHEQFVPGTGMNGIGTLGEYEASPYAQGAKPTRCVDCHAAKDANGTADHAMIGGNVYYAKQILQDDGIATREQASLAKALTLSAARSAGAIVITVKNVGAGHAFPTGVTDIREPWVELQAVDASHNTLARYGGPAPDGTIPLNAARFGMDIAQPDGGLLLKHELSLATRVTFSLFVPPQGEQIVILPAPATLPAGAVELDAVLLYRNVRTPYFRAAMGDASVVAPEVEVVRAAVP